MLAFYKFPNYAHQKINSSLTKGRNLEKRILAKKLTDEVSIFNIFKNIVSFVIYMHHHNYIHRDLRLDNILFDGKRIKIDDFQKATKLKPGKKLKEITGNPYYVAPEIIKGKYGHGVDVWALGVILYTMVFNKFPFTGDSTDETIEMIRNPHQSPNYDFAPSQRRKGYTNKG